MKRIVDGKTYNTETATRVAESEWEGFDNERSTRVHERTIMYAGLFTCKHLLTC